MSKLLPRAAFLHDIRTPYSWRRLVRRWTSPAGVPTGRQTMTNITTNAEHPNSLHSSTTFDVAVEWSRLFFDDDVGTALNPLVA